MISEILCTHGCDVVKEDKEWWLRLSVLSEVLSDGAVCCPCGNAVWAGRGNDELREVFMEGFDAQFRSIL